MTQPDHEAFLKRRSELLDELDFLRLNIFNCRYEEFQSARKAGIPNDKKTTMRLRRFEEVEKFLLLEEPMSGEKLFCRLAREGVSYWVARKHFRHGMNIERFILGKRNRTNLLEDKPELLKRFIRRGKNEKLWISAKRTKVWLARNGVEVAESTVFAYRKKYCGAYLQRRRDMEEGY